ncbi:hypothetical protein BGZ63DRAFT_450371 [Mariannaea sp. PMI_226]|nr:hypothetical protein BGZ63DRAFT_450371 [Mariannaea sp. PMI_226]
MPLATRTVLSAIVKNNPFLLADKEAKATVTKPKLTTKSIKAKMPTRPSDCIPQRKPQQTLGSSGDEARRYNASCRKSRAGHDAFRHSIECAARQSAVTGIKKPQNLGKANQNEALESQPQVYSPLSGALQKRIDLLYQHAENLHHSQHIMEHLAAGSRALDQGTNKRTFVNTPTVVQTRMKMPVFTRDYSLARDDTATTQDESTLPSLSLDRKQPEPAPTETHTIPYDDVVIVDSLSPRSHSLAHDILTEAAKPVESHSISQDSRSDKEGENTHLPRKPITPLESVNSGNTERAAGKLLPFDPGQPHSSSKRVYLYPPQKPQRSKHLKAVIGHSESKSDEQRRLKEVRRDTGASDISAWRKQLRKVDVSEERRQEKLPTPPISKWRRSLSKPPLSPQPGAIRRSACTFCQGTESSSPTQEETTIPRSGIEPGRDANLQVRSPSPPLRLKQVEMSLAQTRSKRLAGEPNSDTEKGVSQMNAFTKTEYSKLPHQVCRKKTEAIAEVHSPKPLLPLNHVCVWRTRYLDLSTEVDQLKSEASSLAPENRRKGELLVQHSNASVAAELGQHQCPDIMIEGLTIVMHMRGKDDLVINTNLKQDGHRKR